LSLIFTDFQLEIQEVAGLTRLGQHLLRELVKVKGERGHAKEGPWGFSLPQDLVDLIQPFDLRILEGKEGLTLSFGIPIFRSLALDESVISLAFGILGPLGLFDLNIKAHASLLSNGLQVISVDTKVDLL
jgi:hypothetical protein